MGLSGDLNFIKYICFYLCAAAILNPGVNVLSLSFAAVSESGVGKYHTVNRGTHRCSRRCYQKKGEGWWNLPPPPLRATPEASSDRTVSVSEAMPFANAGKGLCLCPYNPLLSSLSYAPPRLRAALGGCRGHCRHCAGTYLPQKHWTRMASTPAVVCRSPSSTNWVTRRGVFPAQHRLCCMRG